MRKDGEEDPLTVVDPFSTIHTEELEHGNNA